MNHFVRTSMSLSRRLRLTVLALAACSLCLPGAKNAEGAGYVYVATNQPAGNTVIQYARNSDGSLTKLSEIPTGGLGGTGNGVGPIDPLGSADS
jgi:hypothetical protein